MSKRMMRIKPDRLFEKLKALDGILLNAVLENGRTYFGTLIDVTSDFMILRDTRYHNHKILFTTIYEIVYDYEN
jgi:hypothetical protein